MELLEQSAGTGRLDSLTPRTLRYTFPHVTRDRRLRLTCQVPCDVRHRARRVVPKWSPTIWLLVKAHSTGGDRHNELRCTRMAICPQEVHG
jgi:hypothetical protein